MRNLVLLFGRAGRCLDLTLKGVRLPGCAWAQPWLCFTLPAGHNDVVLKGFEKYIKLMGLTDAKTQL